MFEFSIVAKYLLPRWKHLSVSIISLLSIFVISLVVWLIVVFFSVTHGLEKVWTNKLLALTAPVRITPTEKYYQSYYYLIDEISSSANYSLKTLGEKRITSMEDPYDPDYDQELPSWFPSPELDEKKHLKPLVQELFASIDEIKNVSDLKVEDFETGFTDLYLQITKKTSQEKPFTETISTMKYPSLVSSFSFENETLQKTILPLREEDAQNIFLSLTPSSSFQKKIKQFFSLFKVEKLKTTSRGSQIPALFFEGKSLLFCFANRDKDGKIERIWIPKENQISNLLGKSEKGEKGQFFVQQGMTTFITALGEKENLISSVPLFLEEDIQFSCLLDQTKLSSVSFPKDVVFHAEIRVQGQTLKGDLSFAGFDFAKVTSFSPSLFPFSSLDEPKEENSSFAESEKEGIFLPRGFRDLGVRVADSAFVTYTTPTATTIKEEKLPVYVAGFYDPGIIPVGGKIILAPKEVISLIRSSQNPHHHPLSNGIHLRFSDYTQALPVKQNLEKELTKRGLTSFFKVESYQEYEFAKDLIKQLHSEKNLFSLLAIVIIIVACSNIVSMLIILVNDKKEEIGILRSMGANSFSMALIFGSCGLIMGTIGSLIGTIVGIFTLSNLELLVGALSFFQGHEMFNASIYGESLPNEISFSALSFVFIATMIVSLLSGLIPAIKACRLKPTAILRAE